MNQDERSSLVNQIYSVDSNNVFGFFKAHRFLSNFHEVGLMYNGIHFDSTEAAYQAQKTTNRTLQMKMAIMRPAAVKGLGQTISMRPDWEEIKLRVMLEINEIKFAKWELKEMLIETGHKYLEETNYWGDTFWGCNMQHEGRNELGKILMKIRKKYL